MDEEVSLEEELYKMKVSDFFDSYEAYLISETIPDALAYYLANGYKKDCLSECPLKNHLNSALDSFNISCDIEELIPKIEEKLKLKYNLKIENKEKTKITKCI